MKWFLSLFLAALMLLVLCVPDADAARRGRGRARGRANVRRVVRGNNVRFRARARIHNGVGFVGNSVYGHGVQTLVLPYHPSVLIAAPAYVPAVGFAPAPAFVPSVVPEEVPAPLEAVPLADPPVTYLAPAACAHAVVAAFDPFASGYGYGGFGGLVVSGHNFFHRSAFFDHRSFRGRRR